MVGFVLPNICLSKNERRIALIIGNGNYTHGGSLSNPVNDVRSIQRALEGLGFTVLKYENCSQKTMKKVIDRFGRKLKDYDVGLFFYAGHGVQVKNNNYLIPVDAKLDDENDAEYNCVRAGRILAKMESAGTRTNIVILDACRDNPFERSWRRGTEGCGFAFMNAPSGSLIAYSTSPGKTAFDGKDTNSPYTSALLQHINSPDITIIQMFQRVRSTVRAKSGNKQTPWESTSLSGDFYFNSGSGVVTVERPSSDQTDALIEERARIERERRELEQQKAEFEKQKLETASLPQKSSYTRPSSTSDVIERDGVYVAYANGIVRDTKTGLEWKVGPDKDTNWNEAKSWVRSLNLDGGGWRMPTMDKLKGLYKKGVGSRNMTPLLKTSGLDVWSSDEKRSKIRGLPFSWYFRFSNGYSEWAARHRDAGKRAFAVRSRSYG